MCLGISTKRKRDVTTSFRRGVTSRDLCASLVSMGSFVIMRGGPYMCGEWEFGGLPAWLLQNGTIRLRTDAQPYLSRVDRYYTVLLNVVKPLLYENGGPVIMFQVENEYGSYGNVADNPSDRRYMVHLVKRARAMLGPRVVLFTTDGANSAYMSRGSINGSSVTTMGDRVQ